MSHLERGDYQLVTISTLPHLYKAGPITEESDGDGLTSKCVMYSYSQAELEDRIHTPNSSPRTPPRISRKEKGFRMKQKRKRKSKRNKPTDGPEIYQEAVYDYYERQSAARHIDPECCFSLEALPARKSHKFNRLYEAIEYGRTAYQTETTDDSVKDTRSKFLELVLDLEPKFKAYQELMHKHGETGLSEQMRSKNSKRRRKRRTK